MTKDKWSKRDGLGPRAGKADNRIKTFEAGYSFVEAHPDNKYKTQAGADFYAYATVLKAGKRKGLNVIKFKTKRSSATVCAQCWGCITNCNGTHIDMYTTVIGLIEEEAA